MAASCAEGFEMLHASDQAAGLRRLFRRTPSAVVATTSGRSPRDLAVQTLTALTEGARRWWPSTNTRPTRGCWLAAFGYPDGGDLLGALQGSST